MAYKLFDPRILGASPPEALDFIGNVLQSSTEYSIIAGDLDGRILLWNEGARRLDGYGPEEVIGKASWDVLYTSEDVASGRPREILDAALRDGRWQGLVKRIGKGGRRFTARMVVTPRRDASGR